MDNYYNNAMNSNNSLPGVAPHQLQHTNLTTQHTLPPLQPQHAMMQNNYKSGGHAPRTPITPNTPGSGSMLGGYPQHQMPPQARYNMMQANTYSQPPPPQQQQQQQQQQHQQHQQQQQMFRTSSSMLPQSTTALTQPQSIAPAPGGRVPQPLRPMPANGMHMQPSLTSPYGQANMMAQGQMMMEEQPTHVVGSQGRRGILPSAPGRPAVGTNTSAKGAAVPQKDADGKFPCPHCTKTYLHAKHLKRHLLRHTGDRPYMCVLCRDTFSRSDILKRHFQKCSIRRGNPTGASHLSHAQAHMKKAQAVAHKDPQSMSNENDLMNANGMTNLNDPALHPFGVIPDGSIPDAASHLTDEQAAAQVNNLKRLGREGASMTGLGPAGSNPAGYAQAYAGIASNMPTGMTSSTKFLTPSGQNGYSYNHQGYDLPDQSVVGFPQQQTAQPTVSQSHRNGTQYRISTQLSRLINQDTISPYSTNNSIPPPI